MKRADIASLDDLRAFEATARLGSVRLAADSLALTHGAVSRRISKLSDDLGFRLFEKRGRGLRLTSAGETLNLTSADSSVSWWRPWRTCVPQTPGRAHWCSHASLPSRCVG